MSLNGKVVLITGGARGIGKETALKFASLGSTVVAVDLNKELLDSLVFEVTQKGGSCMGVTCDVTNRSEVTALVESVERQYGRVDVLINNAGITADATLMKMDEDEWDRVVDVNLKGVYLCGQACARSMAETGGGVILNTSSVVGIYGNFGQTNYAATKWGVIGMTKTWAKELGKKGIRVNAVAPGFIMTEMTEKMPENVLDMMKNKSPLKSLGQPSDIAAAFAYLASDDAKFITGTVLQIDGGAVL